MSQLGAALKTNEIVKCIEELCGKRDELHQEILKEEEEKQKLESEKKLLTERLAKNIERLANVKDSLAKKMASLK